MEKEPSRITLLTPTLISAFFTFLFGLLGVLIGGIWQQHYAIQLEEKKSLLELRRNAYSNFFDGQTDLKLLDQKASSLPKDEMDRLEKEYMSKVLNARFHVAVYSSKLTVEAMSNFFNDEKYFKDVGECSDAKQYREDAQIYIRMREEHLGAGDEERVSPDKMTLLIHNCRLK